MCTQIDLPDRTIESCGELAALVGGMDELHFTDGIELKPENCLCGVSVSRTLLNAGYWVRKTPFGYEANKGPSSD